MNLVNLSQSSNVYIQQCGFVVINDEVTSSKACIIRKMGDPEFTPSLNGGPDWVFVISIVLLMVLVSRLVWCFIPHANKQS